jgi:hypothetical protein
MKKYTLEETQKHLNFVDCVEICFEVAWAESLHLCKYACEVSLQWGESLPAAKCSRVRIPAQPPVRVKGLPLKSLNDTLQKKL